ncbi:MAG TPA: hypothetical protein VJ946_10305 [Bacteroidales bacterium]|nr:hypothetical protein [Bacteroidales bacterium]
MKKILLVSIIITMSAFAAKAQYSNGIGLRGSLYTGITYKKAAGDNYMEYIFSTRWGGFNLTGLWEMQQSIPDVNGLYWYYGGGIHAGLWDRDRAVWFDEPGDDVLVAGVDGIIGIEYVFDEFPFSVSLDYKPAFNLIGYTGFLADNGAFSVRYTF